MNIAWDEEHYENNFAFVHRYGQQVLDLLELASGATVLDLGCGNGTLTQALVERGYRAFGLDDSAEMVAAARSAYHNIDFIHANAIDFTLDESLDAVFSNAVLHWIGREDQPALLASVARALKPGGQFVFECGGFGNAHLIHGALAVAFAKRGLAYQTPQYFPTIGEYATMMETAGFKVTFATLFDRFTPLVGEDGLADWIRTFQQSAFAGMNDESREAIIREVVDALRSRLFVDGVWHADYVRLRMKALKFDKSERGDQRFSLKPVISPLPSQAAKSRAASDGIGMRAGKGSADDRDAFREAQIRDITEDDDGYHPYADVPDTRPLFEENPWD